MLWRCILLLCILSGGIRTTSSAQSNQALANRIDELLVNTHYLEAINLIDQTSLNDDVFAIRLTSKKAEALTGLGQYNQAEELLREVRKRAEKFHNSEVTGMIDARFGFLYLVKGRTDLAEEYLHQALSALNQGPPSLETAQAASYLGQVYLSTGKLAQAEEQLQMALTIRKDLLPETHELLAASYNDLGLVYSTLNPDMALDYYDQATALYQKLHGNEHPKLAIANTNLGFAYSRLKLYGDAITSFETALGIWEKVTPGSHPSKAYVLLNLGLTYAQMGDLTAAVGFYEKSLYMYEAVYGSKHPEIAYVQNLIGNIEKTRENFIAALDRYQQALIANVADFNSSDVNQNPNGRNFYNGNTLVYSMMYKAQALESRYLTKTLRQADLEYALRNIQQCDSLIDRLRQQTANESDKITLGSLANEVYADGVRIAFTLSEVAFRNRKMYREVSFYFAEKSKSAVLLDAISETNAKSYAGIPENLLEEEKNLKTSLALVSQKLKQKPSADEEKYLRETLYHLNQSYQEFTANLEKKFPEYFNLKYNTTAPSIQQLQKLLNRSSAILSYFIDENNQRLYTFIVTHSSHSIRSVALPATYDKLLTGLRNSMYYMDVDAFKTTSHQVASLLLPRLPKAITEWVILPTGRMSVIPFEALLTKKPKGATESYESLPYVINKAEVRYEFSAGLLLQKQNTSKTDLQSALFCAPVTFFQGLNDLPGTEQEVQSISRLFQEQKISCNVLLGHEATESHLKHTPLKSYEVIHLATHGVVDELNPELSRIFLHQETEAEDGNLYSGEIYNLELGAELVTLSACQTGLGKISRGEGVIGLSRALVYAGAKNIIVSFWSVADASTAKLMENFYRELVTSPQASFSSSLRSSKRKLLSGEFAAPYYWAPFVLIGF
jgi:CHAT domain-containing protein